MIKRTCLIALFCAAGACSTVHSAYLSNLSRSPDGAHLIEAASSKSVFLGMNFSNDYAFEAREKLYAQCPGGTVTGVLSTYETTSYLIVTTHEVRAKGYCVQRGAGAAAAPTGVTP